MKLATSRIITSVISRRKKIIKVSTVKETMALAKKISKGLKGGDVLALYGNLGAGKTQFVKGLARALSIREEVTSPTFLLMKLYACGTRAKKKGITQLCHIDAYRITSEQYLEGIGVRDYVGEKHTITVVEWAERVPGLIPPGAIHIFFKLGQKEDALLG